MTTSLKILVGCVAIMLVVSSCAKREYQAISIEAEPKIIECLAVLPAQISYTEEDPTARKKESLEKGVEYLNEILLSELEKSEVEKIIDVRQINFGFNDISGGAVNRIPIVSEKAQCNYVLESTLSQYRQRQGGNYAVESPASAAFELRLTDGKSGKKLWMTTFRETQTSLLSNLFTFNKALKRGFKWITVEDLLEQGVQKKIEECPFFYQVKK